MKCPFCQADDTKVQDSRETEEGKITRRRRQCSKCMGRFTTFEKIQLRQLMVIKRSGLKRPFDQSKISKSIATALRKRNHNENKVEELTKKITLELETSNLKEVPSRTIGKMIMQELAKIDHVAYIRFASVYKDFTNAQDFARFISQIKENQ